MSINSNSRIGQIFQYTQDSDGPAGAGVGNVAIDITKTYFSLESSKIISISRASGTLTPPYYIGTIGIINNTANVQVRSSTGAGTETGIFRLTWQTQI